jgi:hypothetical protein
MENKLLTEMYERHTILMKEHNAVFDMYCDFKGVDEVALVLYGIDFKDNYDIKPYNDIYSKYSSDINIKEEYYRNEIINEEYNMIKNYLSDSDDE